MIVYIIVEGSFDAQLLTLLLPKNLLDEVAIVSAGSSSAVKSLARSLLVRRQVPIAIVVDADCTTPELIQERRQSIEEIVTSELVRFRPLAVCLSSCMIYQSICSIRSR